MVQPQARDVSLFDTVPFVGSAEEIVDRIGEARDLLGLTRIGLAVDLGGLEQATVLEQIDMLAADVLPALAERVIDRLTTRDEGRGAEREVGILYRVAYVRTHRWKWPRV